MPFDMKTLTLDVAAATSSTVLFGAIGGQTDSQPIPIPINILGTYIQANFSGSGANPTASVGLAAVNGSATTFLRSDGAPALSQAIAPTWTGQHIFNLNGAASTPPALLNGTWFTGGSATTTKPQFLIEPSGTTSTGWSTSGTGLGVNAASGFTGNLCDLQIAGSSKASVDASGNVLLVGKLGVGSGAVGASVAGDITASRNSSTGYVALGSDGTCNFFRAGTSIQLTINNVVAWNTPAASTFQLGAADAATATAQTLQVQNVAAGNSNVNGANWTLNGSVSTGTGTSGDIIFQTGGTGAGATSQNAEVTALTIKGATQQVILATNPRINVAPTANGSASTTITSGADSSTNLGHRISFNLNGTTYWIPCGSVAF